MNIVWFRQDLRITDNPALHAAAASGPILPLYILDDSNAADAQMGGTSRVWLHHALNALNRSLDGHLQVFRGNPLTILNTLCQTHAIKNIFWNRCYEPWRIKRDTDIKQTLSAQSIHVQSFNGSLLWEPWDVLKKDGTPYKVFTPFYRKGCLTKPSPRAPLPAPSAFEFLETPQSENTADSLSLLPSLDWHKSVSADWDISEAGAQTRLNRFLEHAIHDYKNGRNLPSKTGVSRLSAYLHFGQISPNQVWHATLDAQPTDGVDVYQSELGLREFSYSLLYHFPQLPKDNLQPRFDAFPWIMNENHLNAWQRGLTGYPIVDAGMRELWQTGYMHNRVRMIVGSFLVKNLLIHWHHGEAWFWDCLFDSDLASNSASWQWIAGCGADAAPYFRIFNPITQGEKFDADGRYTRRYVPELADLPDKYLFQPWSAPAEVLQRANVILGKNYPQPIVDLKSSRQRALDAYQQTRH